MIIVQGDIAEVCGKVSMVDGSFDPLHDGHIEYFRQAADMWSPLLCNIAPDSWTQAKHPILLPREKRAVVIDAIHYIDYVFLADCLTVEVLEMIRPKLYIKGNDWKERGGIPCEEREVCEKLGIQVVYLDTVHNSSSQLLMQFRGGDQR